MVAVTDVDICATMIDLSLLWAASGQVPTACVAATSGSSAERLCSSRTLVSRLYPPAYHTSPPGGAGVRGVGSGRSGGEKKGLGQIYNIAGGGSGATQDRGSL